MNEIFAYRLKNARIQQGFGSVESLAKELGVSKQMISKYEKGLSMPDGGKLIALANILGVKPDYFFMPATVELSDIKFRKKAKASKKTIEQIKINILNNMENYLLIEDILAIKSEFNDPLKNNVVNSIDNVEELALQLRKKWKIGNDPISNIIALFEANEIKVIEIDADDNNAFDGMSGMVNNKFPAVVINKNYNVERKRFTLLHELGHLLLNIEHFPDKEQEKICDRFAGAVLLPKDTLLKEVGPVRKRISVTELISFQKRFGLSIGAIMYRLVSLNIISQSKIKSFYIRQNTDANFKAYINEVRFLNDEASNRYKQLVYRGLTQELISISKASAMLNTDIDSLQKQLTIL